MPQPKRKDWLTGYKNKTPIYAVYKRPTSKQGTIKKKKERSPIFKLNFIYIFKFGVFVFVFKYFISKFILSDISIATPALF